MKHKAWSGFIEKIVQDACEVLGVNVSDSRPRCDLYKLLLYETGGQ